MKNLFLLCVLCLAFFAIAIINSCTKESMRGTVPTTPYVPPNLTPITSSYNEEFADVSILTDKGWAIGEYSEADTVGTTAWVQGNYGPGKADPVWYGFTADSPSASPYEYIYSYEPAFDSSLSISSWLLTPILTVKNGDKISFTTRGDTTAVYTDRMQVLLSASASLYVGHALTTVGDFTTVLYDINAQQVPGGYPITWTKYEYTFSGISGKTNIRIAFRHFALHPANARGIGIDHFKFEVN
jgi:hypothetical protein